MNTQGVRIVPIGGALSCEVGLQPLWKVNEINQILPNNKLGGALRPQDLQGARLSYNGRVNINITESHGPFVLAPLPQGIRL